MTILDEIVANKRKEIAARMRECPLSALQDQTLCLPMPPPFSEALCAVPTGLIAEVKRRSPSAGTIRDPFDPAQIAGAYQRAGAQAVSVLMDEYYFGGGAKDFQAVRAAVSLPMLFKEFVVDSWQIWQARLLGASAVLLIASVLNDDELGDFMRIASEAGLETLLEVHDGDELHRALKLNAPLIGINNRNLKTFETRLEHTLDLMPLVPETARVISESGIRNHEDVARLRDAGVSGILVGEHLLREPDLETAVRRLLGT